MDREQFSVNELTVGNIIGGVGVDPYRKKVYLNGAVGSDGNAVDVPSNSAPVKTLTNAYNSIGTYNDAVVLQQSSSSVNLATAFNWQKNCCALIGTGSSRMNMRSRIGMSTTFTPFVTVSGYGNLVQNIYAMHGTAATDLVGWSITGDRNTFDNTHFAGPMSATQDTSGYKRVSIAATETYFKDCTFGTNTINRAGAYPNVELGVPSGDTYSYTTFENCTFLASISAGSPMFINVLNNTTPNEIYAEFINCRFIATSANMNTSMTYAFTFAGSYTAGLFFNSGCQFYGVSGLAATANLKYIWTPRQFPASADTLNLISLNTY